MTTYEKLKGCLECVTQKTEFKPEVAVVLGSGLGNYGKKIDVRETISYTEIEGFPVSTVPGHSGKFLFGYVDDVPVVLMQGRVHFYEGYEMEDVVLPTRLMGLMGAKAIFLTNAAGGVNPTFNPGDLMLIRDHISQFVASPLKGSNIDELGTRFPDMSCVYDRELCNAIRKSAAENSIPLKEGVYMQTKGPQFETPAEIRMARAFGADAVGMSTACEAIAAHHMGMRVCGVSCVSNLAAGMNKKPLTHAEVQETAKLVEDKFTRLATASIVAISKEIKKD